VPDPRKAVQRAERQTTSLGCIDRLHPKAAAVTSACSCFAKEYALRAVTSTITAPTVTKTVAPQPTCPGGFPAVEPPVCIDEAALCGTNSKSGLPCECQKNTEGRAVCAEGLWDVSLFCKTTADCDPGYTCVPTTCLGGDPDKVCVQQDGCPGGTPSKRDAVNPLTGGMARPVYDAALGGVKIVID